MARTKAPLFGLDASGSLAESIVFSKWRGRTYVRRHAVPANPKSGLQVGMRSVLKFITQDFTNLTAAEKAEWDALAAITNITQLNAQVADAGERARRNLGWRLGPAEAAGTTPSLPTLVVAAQPKALEVTITAGATAPEYSWGIFMSTSTGFSEGISNLVRAVANDVLVVTLTKLITGTAYYILVKGVNNDGEFGTVSAEGTGTPT